MKLNIGEKVLFGLFSNEQNARTSFPRTPKFEDSQLFGAPPALCLPTRLLICSSIGCFSPGLAVKKGERDRDREGGGKLFLSPTPRPDSTLWFNLMTSLITLLNLSFHEIDHTQWSFQTESSSFRPQPGTTQGTIKWFFSGVHNLGPSLAFDYFSVPIYLQNPLELHTLIPPFKEQNYGHKST